MPVKKTKKTTHTVKKKIEASATVPVEKASVSEVIPDPTPVQPQVQEAIIPTSPVPQIQPLSVTPPPPVITPPVIPVQQPVLLPQEAAILVSPTPVVTPEQVVVQPSPASSWVEPEKPSRRPLIIIISILLLVLIGGIGGLFYWQNSLKKQPVKITASPSTSPTVKPSPTKALPTSVAVDVTKYTIKVLNGSEVSGEAGKAKDRLTAAGFTVSGTGNADKSDLVKTTIQVKSSVDAAVLKKLQDTLVTKYILASPSAILTSASDTDIVVTIGSATQ